MKHTPTQIADICRIYLTIACVVIVLIVALWAVQRTTGIPTTGNQGVPGIPGVPVVSAQHDATASSTLDQGLDQ